MLPRLCSGHWRVTGSQRASKGSASACSVLCRRGQGGVNVTFYLLIFHRREQNWDGEREGEGREREEGGRRRCHKSRDNGEADLSTPSSPLSMPEGLIR